MIFGARRLWILRHGESRAQTGEETGLDTALSALGKKQAAKAGKALSGTAFDGIFVSPLKRARETFEKSGLNRAPVEFDSRLVEILPEGFYYENLLPYEDLPPYGSPERHDAWEKEPFARAAEFLDDVWGREGANFLAVTHGGISSALLNVFLAGKEIGKTESLKYCFTGNAGISVLEHTPDGGGRLLAWNLRAHLGGRETDLP